MTLRHPITGDPILYAPLRAERPHAFAGAPDVERCPFCPGNESDTPPELVRIGDPWRIRVFPNKYPAAAGAEVIVESPRHDDTFASLEHPAGVVRTYVERLHAHAGAPFTALFRNEGERAGSSIAHVHSQIVPLPFVPPRIAREAEGFARAGSCPLCRIDGHVIAETESLVWLAPAASWMPYQQWILPKRHIGSITAFDAVELDELASLLRASAAAMEKMNAAYNWMFLEFSRERAAHAYVEILPRMTTIAGLELGTGTFVEIMDPAVAARRLQE